MPTVKLSPLFNSQTLKSTGVPASGHKINTYTAGSSSALATYTDSTGVTAQANPIVLNSNGLPDNEIWLQAGLIYKFVWTDENDVVIDTFDNISGINDTTSSVGQWVASGVSPSYVSASSFTVPGDQTTDFHVGRRLQFTTTAGTVYGTITASAYSTLTTVTVQMDSGTSLDSGLSVVNLSILRADHKAIPANISSASYGTRGLLGAPNSSTPLTKFDLSADSATLRNAAGGIITRFSTGTIACDLGLAGPAANGRDQSAAFTASSWVHLYFIWNGSTVATLASATAPSAFDGSTLPTGYTHWCYATTIRWNSSSNIVPGCQRGSSFYYNGWQSILSAGTSTTEQTVSATDCVPPIALKYRVAGTLIITSSTGAGTADGAVRIASGLPYVGLNVATDISGGAGRDTQTFEVPNINQSLIYLISNGPNNTASLTLNVNSYVVANA